LEALFEQCAPDLLDDLPSITTKRDIRALLNFIERRSGLNSFRMEGGRRRVILGELGRRRSRLWMRIYRKWSR
jgi:hypothetical protein